MNHYFSVYFIKLQFDKLWKSSPPPLNACKSIPNIERLDLAICSVQNEMVWEESLLLSGLQRTKLRSVMAHCATEHLGKFSGNTDHGFCSVHLACC